MTTDESVPENVFIGRCIHAQTRLKSNQSSAKLPFIPSIEEKIGAMTCWWSTFRLAVKHIQYVHLNPIHVFSSRVLKKKSQGCQPTNAIHLPLSLHYFLCFVLDGSIFFHSCTQSPCFSRKTDLCYCKEKCIFVSSDR